MYQCIKIPDRTKNRCTMNQHTKHLIETQITHEYE
jgi:hypothetical protein